METALTLWIIGYMFSLSFSIAIAHRYNKPYDTILYMLAGVWFLFMWPVMLAIDIAELCTRTK